MTKQKILIVEDNKTLAKLIAKKLQAEVNFDVHVAYNLKEAKLFLKTNKYFLCLLDLNLPDAPNGEIIDYVLADNNHVIILSGNVDKKLRAKLLKKNVIDYINKSGINDINYIISIVKRLEKNQKHSILVVDDSIVFRKTMHQMLENLYYNVISVSNGQEAYDIINSKQKISLVLTDYFMPVMDGLQLTERIREKHDKNEVCIIAISINEEDYINALFLKAGANDYIKKPFSKEEFSCRINNSIEALENINLILNHANRDYLTALYNRRYFFTHMEVFMPMAKQRDQGFVIAMIDIDNFKEINDSYGHDDGDKVIIDLAEILKTNVQHNDIVSRFGGEEFCIVLKDINQDQAVEILGRLIQKIRKSVLVSHTDENINYTVSIGVAQHNSEDIDETISKADKMLFLAKEKGKNQIVFD